MQAAAYLELIRQALEKKAHYQELNRIQLESYRGIESEDEEASIATTRGGDSEGDETSEDVETERRPAMEDEQEMQEMLKRLGFVQMKWHRMDLNCDDLACAWWTARWHAEVVALAVLYPVHCSNT
ncbi:hypothetical protein R1flu_010478 [Riccia fluitans]|uniref:Uncharacterized protein n=1 Tax=Riccia fluitans TaxID=41844 RepID=A0ABD1Z529_9MARC